MAKPIIVTRASKGTALTWTEGDSNFTNLRDATLSVTDGTNTKALNLNDTLTFTAGTNVTLSVNATTGAVTINSSGSSFDPASPGAIGGTTSAAITSTTHTISAANELRFNNTANTFYVGFKAPSLTASKIWTLPTADGTANYVLTTNGSGVLSWSAPSVTSVTLNDSSSNAQYFTLQQSGATSGSYTNYTASGVYFIPSTNTLYTTNLSASIYKGNSETTNTDFQIAFLTSTGNYDYPRINSNLTANPSTGTITATKFAGALNGTVGATTASTGAFTSLSSATLSVMGSGYGTSLSTSVITIGNTTPDATHGRLQIASGNQAGTLDGVNIGATAAGTGSFTSISSSTSTTIKDLRETIATVTYASTITPDVANGTVQKVTLTGNVTFSAFANPVTGQSLTLIITQDATGSRLLTSTMKFSGASKTLSTAANSVDIMTVFYDGTNYYASLAKGFA